MIVTGPIILIGLLAVAGRLPTAPIAGGFNAAANVMTTSNPELTFLVEAKDGRFFETAIAGTPPATTVRTEPIDLVVGSGRKGQTYLSKPGRAGYARLLP